MPTRSTRSQCSLWTLATSAVGFPLSRHGRVGSAEVPVWRPVKFNYRLGVELCRPPCVASDPLCTASERSGNIARPTGGTQHIFKKDHILKKRVLPSGFCIGYYDVLEQLSRADIYIFYYILQKVHVLFKPHLISQQLSAESRDSALYCPTPVS